LFLNNREVFYDRKTSRFYGLLPGLGPDPTLAVSLRDTASVRPYERNPRVNDDAVDAVAAKHRALQKENENRRRFSRSRA